MRAVWLVGLAACGRIGFDPTADDGGAAGSPTVCVDQRTPFSNVPVNAELAVTTTADGFVAAWTDGANAMPATAAKLDVQRRLVVASSFLGDASFRDQNIGGLIETSAGVLALFATDLTGNLWLLAPDLSSAFYASTPVGLLAHDGFVPDRRTGARIVYLSGYQDAVSVGYVRADGALTSSASFTVGGPITELSGNDGDAVWVEDLGAGGSHCSVAEIVYGDTVLPGLQSIRMVSSDCVHARGATGPQPDDAPLVVWQTAGGAIEARYFAASGELARQLSPAGRAPRVRFDGTRFWIAWIDHRTGADQLRVATFDLAGNLGDVAVSAVKPVTDQAFALLRAGTAVYLVVLGADALEFATLCTQP